MIEDVNVECGRHVCFARKQAFVSYAGGVRNTPKAFVIYAGAFIIYAEGVRYLRRRRSLFAPKAFVIYAEGVRYLRRRRSSFTLEAFVIYAGGVLITPEAFANFSPGLERSDNPGFTKQTIG